VNPWKAIPLPYRILIILAFLALYAGFFYVRGTSAERAAWAAKEQAAEIDRQKQAVKAANTGTTAVEAVHEEIKRDAPVVERVVTRVRNVCLHDDKGRVSVPASAEEPARAPEPAQDAGDRAFVDAIESDIKQCADDLARLKGLQQWCIDNGCDKRSEQ